MIKSLGLNMILRSGLVSVSPDVIFKSLVLFFFCNKKKRFFGLASRIWFNKISYEKVEKDLYSVEILFRQY